jgi:hypothetical protein
MDYAALLNGQHFSSTQELYQFFWDEVTVHWTDAYVAAFPKHGEITLQNFLGFAFQIDHVWPWVEAEDIDKELPETRVISFFGISNTNVVVENIRRRRVGWGPTDIIFSPYGGAYDKGHFIAHGFGGPVDVNIFPQRRDINRGWSEEGKRYRKMEQYVAAHPGTFVFSRPIFQDLTECPYFLECGYFDQELQLHVETFPNRYDEKKEL